MHIIRAIDVGYGNIKFTREAKSDGSRAKYDFSNVNCVSQ